ncbi:MAG: type II toxin-antitoxin system HipA family toxin [Solirubrobacterales bacterium]
MAAERDRVAVHLDAGDLGPRRSVGSLVRERDRARSVVSFAYEPGWAGADESFPLDPSLPLYEGQQYPPALPGIFADTAPDRWGRTLLERREATTARREERRPGYLYEWDYLVGVNDLTRMGALRFERGRDGRFIADEPLAIPPIARLRELEHWSRELEQGLSQEMSEEDRWISMLVAPGSSLGGARPKANYLDRGALWIAKFPSREDRHDVGAWEFVVSRLAGAAGIETPETGLLRLDSAYRTFCARRFDRDGDGRRLYASAMTLSGRRDHEDASYLDVARTIVELGDPTAIDVDLRQLFRRVVFNVMTANRDDHLRNHGFLRARRGWRLAPAFDVNPSPEKLEHALAIDDSLRGPDLDLVRETAPLYRLSRARADELVAEVGEAVAGWEVVARDVGLPGEEIERLADAFPGA